jgi:hypothetical protein
MARPKSIDTPDAAHAAVQAGKRMDELITDPVVVEAFAALRGDYIAAWRAGKTVEEREMAWFKLAALDELDTQFRATVGTGQLAAAKLKHM